jgi:hypothetical protein
MAPYEFTYPTGAGEGPEGASDFWDGFVSLTYADATADLDATVGQECRDAGLS